MPPPGPPGRRQDAARRGAQADDGTAWGRQRGDPLFLNTKHKAFGPSGIYQVMKRLARNAGVPNPGPHAMRRTFVVNVLREGANVFSVQALMGHADLQMTRRYCAIAQTDIAEQHRRFSPADRLKPR